jgi:hypothetical protein
VDVGHKDHHAKSGPVEQFAKHGIKYVPADKTKSEIYLAALPLIKSHQVRLLEHTRMISQLVDLERDTTRGGRDSISHPPGAHDDLANVACGGLLAPMAKKPTMRIGYGCPRYGNTGLIHWEDAGEREHSHITVVHVSEKESIEAKEKEHPR